MNPRNRTIAIVGGAVLVVLLVLGIALVATSGGDDAASDTTTGAVTTDTTTGAVTTDTGDGAVAETRPVEVVGDALPQFQSPDADAAVGLAAPLLEGASFDGTPMTIGGPTDGPTMVVFLAHWCPHCNREVPALIELEEQGGIPDDLDVVAVSTAVRADGENYPPSQWVVDMGWPWPVMADSDAATALTAYGASSFPFTVLLDDQGEVIARRSGESSAEATREWLETSLG